MKGDDRVTNMPSSYGNISFSEQLIYDVPNANNARLTSKPCKKTEYVNVDGIGAVLHIATPAAEQTYSNLIGDTRPLQTQCTFPRFTQEPQLTIGEQPIKDINQNPGTQFEGLVLAYDLSNPHGKHGI